MLADRDVYIHTCTRVKHYACVYIRMLVLHDADIPGACCIRVSET